MLFSKGASGAGNYALASTAAAAVLSQLRQAYPLSIEAPQFATRARTAVVTRDWLGGLPSSLARQALIAAALASIVLALAVTLPAWAAFHTGSSIASRTALHSSAGTTSTSSMRTADLSAGTFVGQIPFVEQIRYFDSLTSSQPAAAAFVQGAREASVMSYLQNVGTAVALPYLSSAVESKHQIDAWNAAVLEAQREAQAQAARQAATQAAASHAWEAPPVAHGTGLASTVTFYACVGNGFCGNMASGQRPFPGAAACSSNLPMGTRFVIAGDPNNTVFTCLDRGALSPTWVDVWFYDAADGWSWQSNVGTSSEITIVQ
jgi:hypothetical protein